MFGIKIQLSAGRGGERRTHSDCWGDSRVKHKETRVCVCGCVWERERDVETERRRERERERERQTEREGKRESAEAATPAVWQSRTPSNFDIPSGLQREFCSAADMEPRKCAGSVLIGVYLLATFCCQGGSLMEKSVLFFLSVTRCSEEEDAARQWFLFHICVMWATLRETFVRGLRAAVEAQFDWVRLPSAHLALQEHLYLTVKGRFRSLWRKTFRITWRRAQISWLDV